MLYRIVTGFYLWDLAGVGNQALPCGICFRC
jgi:hypothetical protein